ncbi:hypothetical protein K438DRAFT_529785 [Mycena galopus ATCC 62051]|nr:hypothetical protein K438DRAFT_529785 [Mycena galopus ATCC 62051]
MCRATDSCRERLVRSPCIRGIGSPPRWGWSSGADSAPCVVYRRWAEGRVRRGQSVVIAREEERRRRRVDMDFTRGVHHRLRPLRTSRAKRGQGVSGSWHACLARHSRMEADARCIRGGCGWKGSVICEKWKRQTRARSAGNKHTKLGDARCGFGVRCAGAEENRCAAFLRWCAHGWLYLAGQLLWRLLAR